MWDIPVVYAQETAQPPAGGSAPGAPTSSPLGGMLPMLVIFFAIMYFLLIRPNQKRERERRAMLSSLSKGDEVVTNGGICGTILGLNEKTVVLKISDDPVTKVEFLRGSVSQVAQSDSETKSQK